MNPLIQPLWTTLKNKQHNVMSTFCYNSRNSLLQLLVETEKKGLCSIDFMIAYRKTCQFTLINLDRLNIYRPDKFVRTSYSQGYLRQISTLVRMAFPLPRA